MHLSDFARKWGTPPLLRSPDGRLGLWGHNLPPAMMTDLNVVMATVRAGVPEPVKVAKVQHSPFSRQVDVANPKFYTFGDDPLKVTGEFDGRLVEKMSWNPLTGELLIVPPGQFHAAIKGKAPFDDYVRLVILHKLNKCTFRPFWPTWASKGAYDTPDQVEFFDLNMDAQEACEKALKAAGAKGWTFQYNVDNKALSEMTGQDRW